MSTSNRIFLSRPTWVPQEFEQGLNGFIRLLEGLDLSPKTIGANVFPSKSPLDEVVALMEQCSGAVILGYPQIRVQTGLLKGTPIDGELFLATEWNHIEAALAYAKKLPLLVIHHKNVRRGIFDRGAASSFLYERDLTESNWPLAEDLNGAVRQWKSECLSRQISPPPQAQVSSSPTCPNCSTVGQTFYLSPIPTEFREIEGADFECTRCKFKRPLVQ